MCCFAMAGLAGASGCSSIQVATSSPSQIRSAADAFVLPPPGGPSIVDVEQRPYTNGVQQVISLAGTSTVPGQNYIRVRIFGIANTTVMMTPGTLPMPTSMTIGTR